MENEFGWHNTDRNVWLLGSRLVGDQEVRDPIAEVENQAGIWYWRIYGTRLWGTCGKFFEAINTVSITMTEARSQMLERQA